VKTQLILFLLFFLVSCQEKALQPSRTVLELENCKRENAFLQVDRIVAEAELAQQLQDAKASNDTLQVILNKEKN
jgi:hypothetical protein